MLPPSGPGQLGKGVALPSQVGSKETTMKVLSHCALKNHPPGKESGIVKWAGGLEQQGLRTFFWHTDGPCQGCCASESPVLWKGRRGKGQESQILSEKKRRHSPRAVPLTVGQVAERATWLNEDGHLNDACRGQ